MKKKQYICTACPLGCHLDAKIFDDDTMSVTGNQCIRGEKYANEEYKAPKRVVTTTCKTDSAITPRVPVKTTKPILKDYINELIDELYGIEVKIPVKMSDTIISNYKDTGIDVIATRSIAQ